MTTATAHNTPHHTSALVLFSGGQDSTTCLAQALERFPCRNPRLRLRPAPPRRAARRPTVRDTPARAVARLRERLGDDHLLDLAVLGAMSDTALTRDSEIAFAETGPAHHLRARPQPALPHPRRGAGLSPRHARHIVTRRLRDRLFRLSRLPRRHDEGDASRALARHGPPLPHRHAADVDRQGHTCALAPKPGRPGPGRPDRRAHPHLLPRRPRAPPCVGLWLRNLPGL